MRNRILGLSRLGLPPEATVCVSYLLAGVNASHLNVVVSSLGLLASFVLPDADNVDGKGETDGPDVRDDLRDILKVNKTVNRS